MQPPVPAGKSWSQAGRGWSSSGPGGSAGQGQLSEGNRSCAGLVLPAERCGRFDLSATASTGTSQKCCGGDSPQRAREQSQCHGSSQRIWVFHPKIKQGGGTKLFQMHRSLREEQRGLSLSWAATAGGRRSAHPKKRQSSGRDRALPGETVVTLPKSESTPMQQPRGRGAGESPPGTLELHGWAGTPEGTPEGVNTQGRALSSLWQWGPACASCSSGHSGPSLGRGHQGRWQHLYIKADSVFPK